MFSSGAPAAWSAPSAPDSNRSVMKLLKRLTTNAKRIIGRNHFSRQAQFVSDSLAAQAGKPLRSAIAREDSKFYFGLPEPCGLARETHRTGQRHFASAAQRETVDRRDRGLSQRF